MADSNKTSNIIATGALVVASVSALFSYFSYMDSRNSDSLRSDATRVVAEFFNRGHPWAASEDLFDFPLDYRYSNEDVQREKYRELAANDRSADDTEVALVGVQWDASFVEGRRASLTVEAAKRAPACASNPGKLYQALAYHFDLVRSDDRYLIKAFDATPLGPVQCG